jgi:hypothetical protein
MVHATRLLRCQPRAVASLPSWDGRSASIRPRVRIGGSYTSMVGKCVAFRVLTRASTSARHPAQRHIEGPTGSRLWSHHQLPLHRRFAVVPLSNPLRVRQPSCSRYESTPAMLWGSRGPRGNRRCRLSCQARWRCARRRGSGCSTTRGRGASRRTSRDVSPPAARSDRQVGWFRSSAACCLTSAVQAVPANRVAD